MNMSEDFKMIKLSSGEAIFGRVRFHSSTLFVKHPLVPMYRDAISDDELNSATAMCLVNYMNYLKDDTIKIDQSHVVCVAEILPEMSEYCSLSVEYNKGFQERSAKGIRIATEAFKRAIEEDVDREPSDEDLMGDFFAPGSKAVN